jgi:1-acyl-sn-glycerol-3-phosphate acyltransferase
MGRVGLRMMGFRVVGGVPDLKQFVIAGAPHTSNWDFVLAMSLLFALGLRVNWIGKKTLFRPPMGWVMRWLGGVPTDRAKREGLVQQVVNHFKANERFAIGLSPEGTRRLETEWKSGFYRIAQGANVPIVLAKLDFGRREVSLENFGVPSGDWDRDLEEIRNRFRGATGLRPELFDVA